MKQKIIPLLISLTVLWTLLPPVPVEARTYRLQPDGGGDFPDLASALSHAISSDVIELEDGLYGGPGNRDLDLHGRSIIIRSRSGDPTHCILDADGSASNPGRLFHFHSGEGVGSMLQDITLRGGWVDGDDHTGMGGGILIRNAAPRIEGCIFTGNRAVSGGGIACLSATPRITDCQFLENEAVTDGGGVSLGAESHPELSTSLFRGNTAPYGGGIHCYNSSPALSQLTIISNTASIRGGGISLSNVSSPTIEQCTLAWNSSPWGGGIALMTASLPVIDRCIIAASEAGGAVTNRYSSLATFTCCDLFDNVGGNWVGDHAPQLGHDGNINQDPLFCGDADNADLGLATASPCNGGVCGLMGAWPVSCSGRRQVTVDFSWGAVKTLY